MDVTLERGLIGEVQIGECRRDVTLGCNAMVT
jgi:hypothetical protein